MTTDHLLDETTLTLKEFAAERGIEFSTAWRWLLKGIRSPDGSIIRLEAVRLGGRWITSREAAKRFSDRLTQRISGEPIPLPRSALIRENIARRAGKKLQAMGI